MIKDLFAESWKELEAAIKDKSHPFRVCSLATFKTSEKIKQRLVNLRELTDERSMLFYTDARSSKIEQIEQNNNASALFYNPATQLQLFVRGKIIIHTQDEIWQEHRLRIEGRSVNDYNSKYAPGKKIKDPINLNRTNEIHFAVLELKPQLIEYLKLRVEPNRLRAVFIKKENEWEKNFLVP